MAKPVTLRFGAFELDMGRQELRSGELRVKLQAQPLAVLALLAGRRGELVERQEIRRQLWGDDTYVDYEQGINAAVRQVRRALGDDATAPRFVETEPRRGYRFVAPVEIVPSPPPPAAVPPADPAPARQAASANPPPPGRRRARTAAAAAGLAVAALLAVLSAGQQAVRRAPAAGAAPDVAVVAGPPLVLVLPFDDLGPDAAGGYLADGLTEELITELARRYGGRLGVIARTTAMKYRDAGRPVPAGGSAPARGIGEIAGELGVRWVVEGSVRRAGEQVRVTAQLIRAADQVHLWAGSYDRAAGDALALQSELSETIARALALELGVVPPAGAADGGAATVPAAYDAYLRGRHLVHRARSASAGDAATGRELLTAAGERFRQAVELDPGFAPAHVGLAQVASLSAPPDEALSRVREALARALALDDGLPEAHQRLALLRFYRDWDAEGARQEWQRAIELSPSYAEAHHAFAAYWSATGRHALALAEVERALRLDPRSPGVASDVGWYFYFARRYEPAIEHCRRTLEMEPGYYWARECVLLASLAAGDLEAAAAAVGSDLAALGVPEAELTGLTDAGEPGETLRRLLRRRLELFAPAVDDGRLAPTFLATYEMAAGNDEAAMAALERAYRERAGWILPFLAVHPLFDPLRDDPRFADLVRRIGVGTPG